MPIADLNGLKLSYKSKGQGVPMVLIHGLFASSAFWHIAITRALESKYQVVTYDLRGHGQSEMPPCGYTSADMAIDLECLMDHLGLNCVHLIGHSFGGEIALQFAIRSPQRVQTLTLADARVRLLFPSLIECTGWDVKGGEFGEIVPSTQLSDAAEYLPGTGQAEFSNDNRQGVSQRQFPFPAMLGVNPSRAGRRWSRLLGTTTFSRDFRSPAGMTFEKISGILAPVLALYGSDSAFLPVLGLLRNLIPTFYFHIIPTAGHLFPMTHSNAIVNYLEEFLATAGTSVPGWSTSKANGAMQRTLQGRSD